MECAPQDLAYRFPEEALSELFPLLSSGVKRGRSFSQIVTLPGGYVDEDGLRHYHVELSPITGFEEEWLEALAPDASTAVVVTELLSRCVKRIGSVKTVNTQVIRDLLVGDREFLMQKLRALTFGKTVNAVLFCPDPNCSVSMDVTLNLDAFAPPVKPITHRTFKLEAVYDGEPDPYAIEFRLPTGGDQEEAANWILEDSEQAVNKLLARTIERVNDYRSIDEATIAALPSPVRNRVEERMEELAPLISVELETSCVECRRPFITHFDLSSFFLSELRQSRQILEREVHFLASHYHWPEREILALTRRKRRRYIELIQSETLDAFSTVAVSRGVK